jgi:hypothetical protein
VFFERARQVVALTLEARGERCRGPARARRIIEKNLGGVEFGACFVSPETSEDAGAKAGESGDAAYECARWKRGCGLRSRSVGERAQ